MTPAQLKVTYTGFAGVVNDFGHDEHAVGEVIREVLAKLPGNADMHAVDLSVELVRHRSRS